MSQSSIKFIFFGSSQMSIYVLDELEKAGLLPIAVVTTPDKPKGRKLLLTPTPVKSWAQERKIKVYDPVRLDSNFVQSLKPHPLDESNSLPQPHKEDRERVLSPADAADVFIVASFGKIIPLEILSIPPHQTLNVHPSLLPKYRGASPLQSAILDDTKDTGVTIMRIDEQMDHGPIVAQKEVYVKEWPTYEVFEEMMAREGGRLLVQILPQWISGSIKETEQNHAVATHSRKFIKEDGKINLTDDPYLNFRKIQAFHHWPQAYFFIDKRRIKVTAASFKNGKLIIEKVTPEGGKEVFYESFMQNSQKK